MTRKSVSSSPTSVHMSDQPNIQQPTGMANTQNTIASTSTPRYGPAQAEGKRSVSSENEESKEELVTSSLLSTQVDPTWPENDGWPDTPPSSDCSDVEEEEGSAKSGNEGAPESLSSEIVEHFCSVGRRAVCVAGE